MSAEPAWALGALGAAIAAALYWRLRRSANLTLEPGARSGPDGAQGGAGPAGPSDADRPSDRDLDAPGTSEREAEARERELSLRVQEFLSRTVGSRKGIQVAARTRAASTIGGDFFDFLAVEGNRIGLLVGDVGLTGVEAALATTMAVSFARSLAPGASSPRQVLETINSLIMRYRPVASLTIAVMYAIYDCRDKTLAIANAGMPPPLLNGRPLDLRGAPLGLLDAGALREEKIPLTSGDVLVLFSDGLNATGVGGEKLGWERLFQLVADHMALGADDLLEQLLTTIDRWAGGALSDDRTILCLRVGEGGLGHRRTSPARATRKLVIPASGLPTV